MSHVHLDAQHVRLGVADLRQQPLFGFEPDFSEAADGYGVACGVELLYQLGAGSSIELSAALWADAYLTFILSSSL